MPDHVQVGDWVKYVTSECDDERVAWGCNDDPRGILTPGERYVVDRVEPRSMHTKISLCGFAGLKFNSTHFEVS
jgi:hypothetical protein